MLLVAAIGYAFFAGRQTVLETVPSARGTYLAVMLVAVPGLWWAIALGLDDGLGYTTLVDVAIVVGAVVPLVFVVAAIEKGPDRLVAQLTAVSGYLVVVQALVTGLLHLFLTMLPDMLQVPRPQGTAEPGWLVVLRWKTAISSIGFLVAFVLVLAFSVSTVAKRFRAPDYPFLQAQITMSVGRQRQATDPFATLVEQSYLTTIKLARVVYIAAVFSAQSAQEFGRHARQVALRIWSAVGSAVRFFCIPLIALSAVGIIQLAVVRELAAYAGGVAATSGATAFWGGVLCAAAVILGLCGAAFGFAALAPRTQRFSCNGVGVVVLLAGAFWVLISLSNLATWPIWNALRSVGLDVDALALGDVLWTNNVTMLVTVFVLIVAALISGGVRARGGVERPRFFIMSLGTSAILFCVTYAWLGLPPLSRWVTHAAPPAADLFSVAVVGHASDVKGVALDSTGRILATASADRTARLWNIADPRRPALLATLNGHSDDVNGVAFSPDDHTLATASDDGTVKVWDIADPSRSTLTATLGPLGGIGDQPWIHAAVFSPDGRTLAAAVGDGTARLWSLSAPLRTQPIATIAGHLNYVIAVAFTPDSTKLATGSADLTSKLWDVRSPDRPSLITTLTGHGRVVDGVAFNGDGTILATGSLDNTVRLWQTEGAGSGGVHGRDSRCRGGLRPGVQP
nr:hypothetical protein GCM10020092_053540 [Actinoplanes digitatis]